MIVVMVMMTKNTVGSTVQTMSEGVVVTWVCLGWGAVLGMTREQLTIFIVVAHLVFFKSRWIDRLFCDPDFFSLCWLETRRIDEFFVHSDLFAISRLESRSVLTFSHVNLCIKTTATGKVNVDLGVVVSSLMRKVDVNVCTGVSVVRSREDKRVSRMKSSR